MRVTKKSLVNKYVCLTYLTITGVDNVHGKISDIRKGNGLIDVHIFPVNTFLGSAKHKMHNPLWTVERLYVGNFLIKEFNDYNQCLIHAKKLNT